MSYLKINENQFLEKAELSRLVLSLKEQGYLSLFNFLVEEPGIIMDSSLATSGSFLVETISGTDTVVVRGSSYAYDINSNIISLEEDVIRTIPVDATKYYWFKISHTFTNLEEGTITVDSQGNVTGVDTKFTEILRGQPNFPSKISIYNGSTYSTEFEVLRVLSDTSMILQGDFSSGGFSAGSQYTVIGTFTHDAEIAEDSKNIFQYDSCNLELLTTTSTTPPTLVSGEEFLIAMMTNLAGSIVVTDLRSSYILKTKDLINSDNYALLNRENIFQSIMGFVPQEVDATATSGSGTNNVVLSGASSSFLKVDFTTYSSSNYIYGFLKEDDTPFTIGTVLVIMHSGGGTKSFGSPTTVNGIQIGFEDYSRFLKSSGLIQTQPRLVSLNDIIIVQCVSNEWDTVSGYYRTKWKTLQAPADDMYTIYNYFAVWIPQIQAAPTNVFVSGEGGITDIVSADNAGAKEGDFFIS